MAQKNKGVWLIEKKTKRGWSPLYTGSGFFENTFTGCATDRKATKEARRISVSNRREYRATFYAPINTKG